MAHEAPAGALDALDRRIINTLQDGFPVCERPYAQVAAQLGTDEQTLIGRLGRLLDERFLTRFGPMYQAERLGGAFSLVAMRVPLEDFERVAGIVNGFTEVAHNYEREHEFNMWFVLATETPAGHRRGAQAHRAGERLSLLQHAEARRVLREAEAAGLTP
jgi:siroheme decarboxylase